MLTSTRQSGLVRSALGCGLLLLLVACDEPPVLRSQADARITAPTNGDDPVAAQCQQLRDQVRANRQSQNEAVTISTSPQIVAAAQAKADQRIEQLHERMETLGCSDHDSPSSGTQGRVSPLPPAPNAPSP